MTSGIYRIRDVRTNDCYIGSTIDIDRRFEDHRCDLRRQCHHNVILQNIYNKYGLDIFVFELLEECSKDRLRERERFYLETVQPIYNIARDPSAPMRHRRHTDDTRERMSRAHLGLRHSEEAKLRMRRPKSDQAKENMQRLRVERQNKIAQNSSLGVQQPVLTRAQREALDDSKQSLK